MKTLTVLKKEINNELAISPTKHVQQKHFERLKHVVVNNELNFMKRTRKEKMPKIDTLDALDDEMTSILNTL